MFENLKRKKWVFYFEGFLLIFLGILAITLPQFMTVSIGIMAGIFLMLTGATIFFRALKFKDEQIFWSSLLAGSASMIVGTLMLRNITEGVYALTFLLITYLSLEGIFKIMLAYALKPLKYWGLLLINGLSALLIASIIFAGLPETAFWSLGFILGVYLIIAGFSMVSFGIGLEKISRIIAHH